MLETALTEILNLKEDRVLIVDMGPSEGRGRESFTTLGTARELPRRSGSDNMTGHRGTRCVARGGMVK